MSCFDTHLFSPATGLHAIQSRFHEDAYEAPSGSGQRHNGKAAGASSGQEFRNLAVSDAVEPDDAIEDLPASPSEQMMRQAKEAFERSSDKKAAAAMLAPKFEEAILLADREYEALEKRVEAEVERLEREEAEAARIRLKVELDTAAGTRIVVRTGYADVLMQVGESAKAEELRRQAWDIGLEATFGPALL